MTTLAELTTPLTRETAKAAIYAAIAARGLSTTSWKPGAVVRTIVAALAILLSALSQMQALIASGGFLVTASGTWLTLVARYVYGVERRPGTFATGNVLLSNASGSTYVEAAGDIVVTNGTTGKSYRTTGSVTLTAGSSNVSAEVRAIELGSASTSPAGDVDTLGTPLTGVTVTSAAAIVGTDEEDDATLRLRCLEKTGTASPNGPLDAYAYFARTAVDEDGLTLGVTRVRAVATGDGRVALYAANATGGLIGDPDDPSTPVGALCKHVNENAVPLGVTLEGNDCRTKTNDVTYELWVRSTTTLSETQIKAAVKARLIAFHSGLPIGGDVISPASGKIYVSAIEAIIGGTLAETIKVVVSAPAADVDVDEDEAPVCGAVSGTVYFVAGSVI